MERPNYKFDYERRIPVDEGERISFADHDWEIIPEYNYFIISAPGEVSRHADTLEEAHEIIKELRGC